jgi:hypothetical protein
MVLNMMQLFREAKIILESMRKELTVFFRQYMNKFGVRKKMTSDEPETKKRVELG